MRACAERVAPRDRRRGLGGRRHRDRQGRQALAGGEAAVLGHAGQDRQLPDHGLACTRSASAGRCRWAGRCICPRSGATTRSGGAKAKIPDEVVLPDEAASSRGGAGRAGGRLGDPARRRSSPTAPTATTARFRTGLHDARARVRARGRRAQIERLRAGDDLRGARAQRRDRAAARRSPVPTASPSRCARSPSGCPATRLADARPAATTPGRRGGREPVRLRPRRRRPIRSAATTCRRARSG